MPESPPIHVLIAGPGRADRVARSRSATAWAAAHHQADNFEAYPPAASWTLLLHEGEWLADDAGPELLSLVEQAPADCPGFRLPIRRRLAGAWLRSSSWGAPDELRLIRPGKGGGSAGIAPCAVCQDLAGSLDEWQNQCAAHVADGVVENVPALMTRAWAAWSDQFDDAVEPPERRALALLAWQLASRAAVAARDDETLLLSLPPIVLQREAPSWQGQLEARLTDLENTLSLTRSENDRLRAELARVRKFAERIGLMPLLRLLRRRS